MEVKKTQNNINFKSVIPVKVYSRLPQNPNSYRLAQVPENIKNGTALLIDQINPQPGKAFLPKVVHYFRKMLEQAGELPYQIKILKYCTFKDKHFLLTGNEASLLKVYEEVINKAKNKEEARQDYEAALERIVTNPSKRLKGPHGTPLEIQIYTTSQRKGNFYQQILNDILFKPVDDTL